MAGVGGELFYAVPAECIEPGTSTSDGYDVQAVHLWDGHVAVTVHIRRGEAALHPAARVEAETRVHLRRELVELCVFADTEVNMSTHPEATNLRRWNGRIHCWDAVAAP
ncbi:hypothetical protein [Mycolicibacter senuensis]|uniref:hypothetical protein n=1 Tax=Mycolicibacter senuensis TaxID=386913 RepID=UPI001057D97C|nr:hypothetical protein [Mycolicibacter senuensis]